MVYLGRHVDISSTVRSLQRSLHIGTKEFAYLATCTPEIYVTTYSLSIFRIRFFFTITSHKALLYFATSYINRNQRSGVGICAMTARIKLFYVSIATYLVVFYFGAIACT